MSFIKARGKAAAEVAQKEKVSYEKLLKTFKSGDSYKVRIATAEDYVHYDAHGVFAKGGNGILTTPCIHGKDCPYCKAVNEMYKEFNATGDEETKTTAGQLKKKERFLMAFINLSDGTPLVLDFTKKQANALIQTIIKNEKKLAKSPFEISKSGSGQGTIVSLERIDEEDLSEVELANWEKTSGTTIPDEYFEVLQEKSIEESLEDLRRFGFDISKISSKSVSMEKEKKEESFDDISVDDADTIEYDDVFGELDI